MKATTVMMLSVNSLEVASHIVKPCAGFKLEGITNGNMAKPAVRIMPANDKLEHKKATAPRFAFDAKVVNTDMPIPNKGAKQSTGYSMKLFSQAPATTSTVLFNGFDAALVSTSLVIT